MQAFITAMAYLGLFVLWFMVGIMAVIAYGGGI